MLERRLADFDGRVLRRRDGVAEQTREGAAALEEAARTLRATPGLPELRPSDALCLAARDHANDIGVTGVVSHQGSDGTFAMDRVRRHTSMRSAVGEAISFGQRDATGIVYQLLVDDGIADRGHRRILLSPDFAAVGIAHRAHAAYGSVTVIVLAR